MQVIQINPFTRLHMTNNPHHDSLALLEAESIRIFRETVAEFNNPVMLYSVGKDSSVLLELAIRAFAPEKLPFPLLHVDTGWKFKEIIAFRDRMAKKLDVELIVYTNQDGKRQGISPFSHGSQEYTDVMKTVALRQALDKFGFDAAIGGARRDEEFSRSKEQVYSLRKNHRWSPVIQRPEPWYLCNSRLSNGESMRVFPLSDWTENDIWLYISRNKISVVPLYFSASRPIIRRHGQLIMRDDDRMELEEGEVLQHLQIRFRTLGCWPLTGAIESNATSVDEIIAELEESSITERVGRIIDNEGSMEQKKLKGYF